jgi:hypothetical protein
MKIFSMMNKRRYALLMVGAMVSLMSACGGKQSGKASDENEVISTEQNEPGDSTVYGLACDGSNDTILVFLPREGGDPDTFHILGASRNQQVFGRAMIGDKMAVVVNSRNRHVADRVIDLEELKGKWCYLVKPEMRARAGISQRDQRQELSQDSTFQELMQPREYGIDIKSDYIAHPIGRTYNLSSDEESPVVFPPLKLYRQWRIFNGQLILSETSRDSTGAVCVTHSDTAQFVMMRRDSLVLRFADGSIQGYYRKQEVED